MYGASASTAVPEKPEFGAKDSRLWHVRSINECWCTSSFSIPTEYWCTINAQLQGGKNTSFKSLLTASPPPALTCSILWSSIDTRCSAVQSRHISHGITKKIQTSKPAAAQASAANVCHSRRFNIGHFDKGLHRLHRARSMDGTDLYRKVVKYFTFESSS